MISRLRGTTAIVALATAAGMLAPGAVHAESQSWWLDLEGGLEATDNVAGNPAADDPDNNSGQSDIAATIELDAGYKFVDTDTTRIEVGYDFYQSLYQDQNDFNYRSHNPTFNAWTKTNGLKLGFTYGYLNSIYGEDAPFEQKLSQHSFSPSVAAYLSDVVYLSVFYRYLDKNYDDLNNSRDANTHQGGADLYYYFDKPKRGYVSLGAGFTSEDTRSVAFDYDGYAARAAVQFPVDVFGKQGRLRFSYAYQRRDYDDPTSTPDVLVGPREDNRHTLRAKLELDITDDLKGLAEYRYVNRESNLVTADYQENVGSLGLRFSF
ncbi:MAG: hypothetical protein KBA31_10045 [Alphaproteobacteria bacterium]|nr:hypothetical protein [Alphaproteobacteria bacterium]